MISRRNFLLKSIGATTLFLPARSWSFDQISKLLSIAIEAEEPIYTYLPANNGAGPMWANGMTTVIRVGDYVFASGLETVPEVKGLSNCRWLLFKRYPAGWKLEAKDTVNFNREPCSLGTFGEDVLMTVNPKLADTCTEYCLTQPEIYRFDPHQTQLPHHRLIPTWKTNPGFNDHSYRSMAVDARNKELILFQNYLYHHAEWSFLDKNGRWSASNALKWPVKTYQGKEVPLRLCYSNTALRERKVFFLAADDITEPNEEWKEHKFKLTGAKWDYVFRRLFFTWTDNVLHDEFKPWIEIANVDETAGHIRNQDLWIDPKGKAHLLWTEKATDEKIRDRFLPHIKQQYSIGYAVVHDGNVVMKNAFLPCHEDDDDQIHPQTARFHATPEGRLFVVCYVQGIKSTGEEIAENQIFELYQDGTTSNPIRIPFKKPFINFQTANERAGCSPSDYIDMIGVQRGLTNTISYGCVKIK